MYFCNMEAKSSSWVGFSDEDLKKLQNSSENKASYGSTKGKYGGGLNKRPQRAVTPMKKVQTSQDENVVNEVLHGAKLASSVLPVTAQQHDSDTHESSDSTHRPAEPTAEKVSTSGVAKQVEKNVLTEADGLSREMNNLHQYQQQQKMMEELNKQKKMMLSQALAQRQKKASAETHKLQAVKKELAHLDELLNVDVSVIRDRIECATREYAEANKRYRQAEKEYVESKMDLYKKSDMKEQLTEHLYTIIHQNEIRKAKKLAKLMEQLELECQDDNQSSTLSDIPSLSLLGNIQTVASGNLVPHGQTTLTSSTNEGAADRKENMLDNPTTTTENQSPEDEKTAISNQESE